MSALERGDFEQRQIGQPLRLGVEDSSNENNLPRNGIESGGVLVEGSCRCFRLDEIVKATSNFDDAYVIGIGGFGKVYLGFMDDGGATATVVAIKRLKAESSQGEAEFRMEVKMLSELRHTHLVSLIGYCNERGEMILVYEYIARGTLADHLYKLNNSKCNTSISPLPWERRLNICIGVARGLDHLHSGTSQIFIHRDVKTENILIDELWVSKIADFGLSKGITSHLMTHVTTQVKGTFGFLDPDYALTNRLSTKSDVYAFGAVLLELLCGRPAVDKKLDEEKISLVRWAQQCIEKGRLDRIIDPSLIGQISPDCLKSFVVLANDCLRYSPTSRPTMAEVLHRLELALVSQQGGSKKGIIIKAFQGMMDRRWRVRRGISSSSGQSKISPRESDSNSIPQSYRHFSLAEIRVATNDFNKRLLIPNSHECYIGAADIDGEARSVVIKRIKKVEGVGAGAGSHAKTLHLHPDLVSLIGFSREGHELIFVYDYTANVSL